MNKNLTNELEKRKKSKFANYISEYWIVYLMFLPVLAYVLIFKYGAMSISVIAWKNYNPVAGIFSSPWVEPLWKNFAAFFKSYYCIRTLKNTIIFNLLSILWVFPLPVIFALLLNELKFKKIKKITKTVIFLPFLLSTVIISGFVIDFFAIDGFMTVLMEKVLNIDAKVWLNQPEAFRPLFLGAGMWQYTGFATIVLLASMGLINTSLYEAAEIDGCGSFRKIWHVTLPKIMPAIIVLCLLALFYTSNLGYERILSLYNAITYEKADTIQSFIYRRGLIDNSSDSIAVAVGLVHQTMNFIMIIIVLLFAKKYSKKSLW